MKISKLKHSLVKYLKRCLNPKSRDDCRHIAIATITGCKYIVSWNFKHFVNIKTINKVQAVNKLMNYNEINILLPLGQWDQVIEIFVLTTDNGPWECDVWLCLSSKSTGCLIPAEAENYDLVFDQLSRFKGFDYQSYINAMSSATNNRFVCWTRPG